MVKENSIALLPLDNRPVSYLLPKQIADFSGINLILPERKYLGDLKCESDLAYLEKWLKDLSGIDSLIISLDDFVYGGLVQSRKHNNSLDELKSRAEHIKNTIHDTRYTIYGFSSIMRIPDYNSNEEEKDYWKDYGKKIFKWSELTHKIGNQSSREIPPDILTDYKAHREKNFAVNLQWLKLIHENCFEYLIFSCDDSGKYGVNVIEAEYIKKQIKNHNFSNCAKVISGTDEIPLVLLTKAILKKSEYKPSVSLYFNSTEGKNQIARYESNTIYNSVISQVETLGIEIKDFKDSDIVCFIHCADSVQGDHIFKIEPSDTKQNIDILIKKLERETRPFIIIDLAYANGAEPKLVEALLNSNISWDKLYAYSGWNTCANSTGSALATGVNRWISEKRKIFNEAAFKKCLLTRFLDDYAYQAKIRHEEITEEEVNKKMKPFVQRFSKLLDLKNPDVRFELPWQRAFEVEINY